MDDDENYNYLTSQSNPKSFAQDGTRCINLTDLTKIIKSDNCMFETMIININLNPDKPQHHNILYKDLKSSYGEVYEDGVWVRKKMDEILEILIDTKMDDLSKILHDVGNIINKQSRNKIKDTIKSVGHDRPAARRRLKSILKPIFYNYRELVMETKNKLLI